MNDQLKMRDYPEFDEAIGAGDGPNYDIRDALAQFGIIVKIDDRMPDDSIFACYPVVAEKHGQRFETLPPSAVLAMRKLRER